MTRHCSMTIAILGTLKQLGLERILERRNIRHRRRCRPVIPRRIWPPRSLPKPLLSVSAPCSASFRQRDYRHARRIAEPPGIGVASHAATRRLEGPVRLMVARSRVRIVRRRISHWKTSEPSVCSRAWRSSRRDRHGCAGRNRFPRASRRRHGNGPRNAASSRNSRLRRLRLPAQASTRIVWRGTRTRKDWITILPLAGS